MFQIRPLQENDLIAFKKFTDEEIGIGYYTTDELKNVFRRSQKNGKMFSLVLEGGGRILGIRITYPPGNWESGKGHGLSPEKWPHSLAETGYFQSIFLSKSVAGLGWGGRLSTESMTLLRDEGAKGVVCHSWKESPYDSSTRYLKKLGFEIITEYPNYWKDVQYNCTRCLKPPCKCTAQEMYMDLEKTL